MRTDIDDFNKNSAYIPSRSATIKAYDNAAPLFRKEVTVEGTADEYDLTFNISLPPPNQEGSNIIIIMIMVITISVRNKKFG